MSTFGWIPFYTIEQVIDQIIDWSCFSVMPWLTLERWFFVEELCVRLLAREMKDLSMPKELVVLCDGTCDSPESDKGQATNIQILRDLLVLDASSVDLHPTEGWEVHRLSLENQQTRLVYYDRGLGAPTLDAFGKVVAWSWNPVNFFKDAAYVADKFREASAETVGSGIMDRVAQDYYFLADHYEEGDQIFLLGFSRGAYTLRILVTLLRHLGLIRKDKSTSAEHMQASIVQGFNLYNAAVHPDANAAVLEFRKNTYPYKGVVRFLGLWDTVRGLVLEKVREDAKLSSVVVVARHALSIDEMRIPFKPELWIANKDTTDSEQRWFPGVHADVGGGYSEHGLSNISLAWMLDEAQKNGLIPTPNMDHHLILAQHAPDNLAIQHDSLQASPVGHALNWQVIGGGAYSRPLCQTVLGESIDPSATARYGQTVSIAWCDASSPCPYNPTNLTYAFRAIRNAMRQPDIVINGIEALVIPDDLAMQKANP